MTGEPLGPVEGAVIAALLAPLGYAVRGVDLSVPTDAYLDRWIPARELAHHARIPERQARHHLARLHASGVVERTDLRAFAEAIEVGGRVRLPRWSSLDEPIYRWHAEADPTIYADVESVGGPSPTRDSAPTSEPA